MQRTTTIRPSQDSVSNDFADLAPGEYQRRVLPYVSRTFALTIPQLPRPVRDIVTNAYLLCRIADTVEDDPGLAAEEKVRAQEQFLATPRGDADAQAFVRAVGAVLTDASSPHERELVLHADKVVAYTRSRGRREREILLRCLAIMCRGMGEYQRNAGRGGLKDLADVDRYCYYVAGVVGEMLTELFALHSPGARRNCEKMLALAPSFGEGLQLTNILKWMVKAVIVGSIVTARYDGLLKGLFIAVTTGLPRHRKPIDPDVSDWEKPSMMGYGAPKASGHE